MINLNTAYKETSKDLLDQLVETYTSEFVIPQSKVHRALSAAILSMAPGRMKPMREIDTFNWVARAAQKGSGSKLGRPWLNYVMVKDAMYYASDGSRGHWGETFRDDNVLLHHRGRAINRDLLEYYPNIHDIVLSYKTVGRVTFNPETNPCGLLIGLTEHKFLYELETGLPGDDKYIYLDRQHMLDAITEPGDIKLNLIRNEEVNNGRVSVKWGGGGVGFVVMAYVKTRIVK